MKLSDWAKKKNLSYMTCYRWFKENKLPPGVNAYQTESGTIIVESDESDSTNDQENPISDLLDKAFEYTVENKTIIDFSSYILSNYNLVSKNQKSILKSQNDLMKANKKILSNHFDNILQKEFNLTKDRNDLLREKAHLLKISKNLGLFNFSYDQLKEMENLSEKEILFKYIDIDLEKMNLLILELKNVFDKNSKINKSDDFSEENNEV